MPTPIDQSAILLSAELQHASGVRVEVRDGKVIVERVVVLDSLRNAVELLQDESA